MADKKNFYVPFWIKEEITRRFVPETSIRVIKQLEEGGDLEDVIKTFGDPLKAEFRSIVPPEQIVPFDERRKVLESLVPGGVDLTKFTTKELESRLQALQDIQEAPAEGEKYTIQKDLISQRIFNEIAPKIRTAAKRIQPSISVNDAQIKELADIASNQILDTGKIDPVFLSVHFENMTDQLFPEYVTSPIIKEIVRRFEPDLRREIDLGKFTKAEKIAVGGIDKTEDIAKLQEILKPKKEFEARELELAEFERQLPEESRLAREQFISGEIGRAQDFLGQEVTPQILEELNVRSPLLLRGGQAGGLIAQEAGSIASRIQELAGRLEAEDAAFFIDVGYQSTLRNLLKAQTGFRENLGMQRETERIRREQRFVSGEQDLDIKLREDLFRKQLERNLLAQRQSLARQRELQDRRSRAGFLSGLGGFAGLAIGAGLAAPTGGLSLGTGAFLGKEIGEELGNFEGT